jgi:glycosyltransferase involved in cell wall biosynthesis
VDDQRVVTSVLSDPEPPTVSAPPASPRILLACDWLLKYAAGLAQGLREAGAEVALLTRDHGLEYGGNIDEMRADLEARLGPESPLWLAPGRVRDVGAVGEMRRIAAEAREFGADAVHFQQSLMDDPRLFWAAGGRPRKYAVTLHDPSVHPGDHQPSRVFHGMEGLLFLGARVVFTHGLALEDESREKWWCRAPIEHVPHGVDVVEPAPLPEHPTLLFFGRISHYKGLDVLFAAMPRVWDAAPDTRLVVAGEGDVPPSHVLDDPRVTLRAEHVPEADVPGLYNNATAVVLPYRQASQSGVGSLAKSFGRGSVVTDEGGLPELVADGSGIVVPSEDPHALADALLEVLTEPGRAAELGAAAAATAASGSSWASVGQATLEAYRRHGLLS